MAKTAILLKLEPDLLARIDGWTGGQATRTGKITDLITMGLAGPNLATLVEGYRASKLPAPYEPPVVKVREHIVTPPSPGKLPRGWVGVATDGTPLTRPRSFQKPGKPK